MQFVHALIPAVFLAGTVMSATDARTTRLDDPDSHRLSWNARHHHFRHNARVSAAKRPSETHDRKALSAASLKLQLAYAIKHKITDVSPTTETARVAPADPFIIRVVGAATEPIVEPVDAVVVKQQIARVAPMRLTKTLRSGPREIGRPFKLARRPISQFRIKPNETNDTGFVVDIIRELAPSYGVPTWFALRIASVESGFDPYTRGLAGEIGVYQLKCDTARAMGFTGDCYELTDARTNVRWGLRHLSLAIESSGGDLHLAASKHNGGLSRTSLVQTYIAKVF